MKWTQQQELILSTVSSTKGPVMIEARAGCAKTTTIVEASRRTGGLFLAYNKSIAGDIKSKGVNARTIHSLAFSLIPKGSTLEVGKLKFLHAKLGLKSPEYTLKAMISCAKNYLPYNPKEFFRGWYTHKLDAGEISPVENEELLFTECVTLYEASLADTKILDFDDLVILLIDPAYKERFPLLFLDEVQDFSSVMAQATLNIAKRIIAVGDPLQSIYQFRGASAGQFKKFQDTLKVKALPLSYTFRCARSIVERANLYAPDLCTFREEEGICEVENFSAYPETPDNFDAYLAHTNAECLDMFLELTKKGKRVKFLGRMLESLSKELKPFSEKGELEEEFKRLQNAIEFRPSIKKATQAELYETCIEALDRVGITLQEMKDIFNTRHIDVDCVVSTIHCAKGLEWNSVYFLDSMHRVDELATNLRYVATTRARNRLKVDSVTIPR